MPRKHKGSSANIAAESKGQSVSTISSAVIVRPAYIDGPPVTPDGEIIRADHSANETAQKTNRPEGEQKNWGPPYKAIITCSAKGFEMGENRRFKQRVFKFKEKPDAEIIAALKDKGFTYRSDEKAWTIPADNASRQLTDQLAAQFAGGSKDIAR